MESLIRWKDRDGREEGGSLFAVLAALSCDQVMGFPALRPHQREPWHAFLVQCAAMALIRAGRSEFPEDEGRWRQLLIGLTPAYPDGTAWSLVVDDWRRPALLQPPVVRPTDRADHKARLETPDALDMLVTSKNHDVKQARMAAARDEDWLFALVTLQTMEGYLGAGNFGISRMNGGFATRMSLGIRPAGGPAAAFQRDVRQLVSIAGADKDWRTGLPLLWLEPWDGTVQLDFTRLDTLYVDICRRVRLVRGDSGLTALAASSKVPRVAATALAGRTRDPWAPIKPDGSASLTPSPATFGYRHFAKLIAQQSGRPMLAMPADSDDARGLSIVATALIRGQGKTEGLHRRTIPLSRTEYRGLRGDIYLDRMGAVATHRSTQAGEVRVRLRRALMALMQGGPDRVRLDDDSSGRKAEAPLRDFDLLVDRAFFDDAFWAAFEERREPHDRLWRERLRRIAGQVFEQAADAAPRTDVRRIRARAVARNMLDGALNSYVKEIRDDG